MMAGGLFTVGFNHRHVDRPRKYGIQEYESNLKVLALGFEKLVVHLAKEADVEINVGSSFGFNNTRIALYEHYGEKVEGSTVRPLLPHLRIAPGTRP